MDSQHDDDLVSALRRAARTLVTQRSIRDLEQTLGLIVSSAVETIPGVDAGSISITEHGRIETRHPTSETIRKLDETQSELREGPCIQAIEDPPETGIVVALDFAGADADRWPRFAPRAVEAGFRALMSTQMAGEIGARAALNLYSHTPGAFDERARTLAGLFGAQAAVLLYGSDHANHLQRAVDSRDLIGQAKVESDRGAVPASQLVRFPGPLPEPDVRLPPHPALHEPVSSGVRRSRLVFGPTAWRCGARGSGSG